LNPVTENDIKLFADNPHLFGHFLGYKDLIPIHSEWIKSAWLGKAKAMQAHRNSYKTTSILVVGAIWYLLFFRPSDTILVIRKAETDAQRIIKTIKAHLESQKVVDVADKIHGNIKTLKTQNWSNSSITISIKKTKTPEGSIDAKGTTSAITGSHYDRIIPDDIITLKDRVSRAERDWVKDFVRELRNIIKEGGKIFFSGTPWHKDDAWSIMPTPLLYPIGTVNIKGYTKDKIKDKISELRAGTTRSLYCANYDLKHIDDEDKIFTEPNRGRWPYKFSVLVAWLDPAYSGKNTNALTIIGKSADEDTEGEWFVRGFVWNKNVVDIYDDIVEKLKMYNVGNLYIESNADKSLSAKDMRKKYHSVIPKWEKQNKHMKIISYAKQHWHKLNFADDCNNEYLNQILDYVEGEEPDDAPDSLAAVMRELGFSGHQIHKPSNKSIHNVLGW
jgi:hypothetical protein